MTKKKKLLYFSMLAVFCFLTTTITIILLFHIIGGRFVLLTMGDFSNALDVPPPTTTQQKASSSSSNTSRPVPNTSSSSSQPSTATNNNNSTSSSSNNNNNNANDDESYRKEFKTLDTDGNGFITKQELQKKIGKMIPAKLLTAAIQLVDKNKDGKISFEEYKEVRTQITKLIPKSKK